MNVFRKKSVEQTLAETGESGHALKRDLTWWDLAIMGVAVAVGAGIFSIGAQAAAFHAGPAVVLSFLIAGVVCGAAVMCYAEFASMIPVAGSAYTFTYTTVGEIVAWVIGWDLILEMLMAGSVVSKYWGVYLNQFFELIGWNINTNIAIGSFNFDLAPVIIVAFFTALLVMGTKIGARVDGALTILKIAIVVFIVVVGFFYIKAENFTPFIPPSEPAASTDGSGVSAVMEQPLWQWATGMAPSIYGVTGIISGALIAFTMSIDDFIISYFTAGSGVSTLAMTIYSMTKKRVSPEINAISTLLFGAVLLLLIIINVRESRQERLRERARA